VQGLGDLGEGSAQRQLAQEAEPSDVQHRASHPSRNPPRQSDKKCR
jgi:hypothetical protein